MSHNNKTFIFIFIFIFILLFSSCARVKVKDKKRSCTPTKSIQNLYDENIKFAGTLPETLIQYSKVKMSDSIETEILAYKAAMDTEIFRIVDQ